MARYWLGPWVWDTRDHPRWMAPDGATGALDLRSLLLCAQRAGVPGLGIFVTPAEHHLGSEYVDLGVDLTGQASLRQRSACETLLRLPWVARAAPVREVLWDLLTVQADPTGEDRCLPLVPMSNRRYQIVLGHRLVRHDRFRLQDPESRLLLDLLQRQYRARRQDALDGRLPPDHYRKVLGAWVEKYGISHRAFQPGDLPDEAPLRPTTVITESFNKANNGLGPDLAWTTFTGSAANVKVFSNQAFGENAPETESRADTDLSTDDQYAQLVFGAGYTGGVNFTGALCRKDSSATRTHYRWGKFNSASGAWELRKFVGGVETNLDSTYVSTASAGQVFRVSADGSTIKGYHIGSPPTERVSATDTAITGNLRCGFFIKSDASLAGFLDNFEAGDLPPGVVTWLPQGFVSGRAQDSVIASGSSQ